MHLAKVSLLNVPNFRYIFFFVLIFRVAVVLPPTFNLFLLFPTDVKRRQEKEPVGDEIQLSYMLSSYKS